MTLTDKLERKMISAMNSPNRNYEFSRLIAWLSVRVNKIPEPAQTFLFASWNEANRRVRSDWYELGWDSWLSFLDNNFEVIKACIIEMETNAMLYEQEILG